MGLLAAYAVLAVCFFFAERGFPRVRQPILRRGIAADVLYVPIHIGLGIVARWTVGGTLTRLGTALLPADMTAVLAARPLALQLAALGVTLEASFYAIHRVKHHFDWWWRLHETHHSAVDLDWLTSARFHPLERVLDRALYLLPLAFLGVSDQALLIWAAADACCGMFAHSNLRVRLGPLIYLFNGPEMHLWHHSQRHAHRCNFGNNLSILDWLLGTAYLPDRYPDRLGVHDPDYPTNDVVAQFRYAFRSNPLGAPGSVR